jgi:transcriptional regulator with XRE-family HTH domain
MPRERVVDRPEAWRQLGKRLSAAMDAAQMSTLDLAARSGFGVAQIERWRAGQSVIYCSQLIVLSQVLGVSTTALFAKDKHLLH